MSKKKLLTTFKSIKRLKEAEYIEIENLVGKSKAKIIHNWISKEKQ